MNTKKRIVADTNVLISFFCYPGGVVGEIMDTALDEETLFVTSEAIILEFEKVIDKKFPGLIAIKSEFSGFIRDKFEIVVPLIKISAVKKDENDNRIIECAVTGNADFIVTGDKHLLELKKYNKILIIRPGDLLKSI